MSLKKIYRYFISRLYSLAFYVELSKTFVTEWIAIIRKYPIYKDVRWTNSQKREFNRFWKKNYGKRIPSMWHKLYQKCSGRFCVDYVPEIIYSTKIEPKMNDYLYQKALEDKFLVEILSMNSGCVVPQTIAVCSDGTYYDKDRIVISKEKAITNITAEHNIIIKPSSGSSSGKGIRILRNASLEEISSVVAGSGKDFIVQKLIVPHKDFAVYNPSSINTIRITTFILNGKTHHFPLCFRIGRSGKEVDNIHAGGLVIGVNDDGALLKNAYELGWGDNAKKMERHPDSGIRFEGRMLPGIPDIIKVASKLQGRYPHIKIISWDFTVNDANEPVLIEANIRGQSVWFPQMVHGKGVFGTHTAEILKLIER